MFIAQYPLLLLDTLPPRVYFEAMAIELKVTGMSCEHCVKAVENALRAIPCVQDVKVDLIGAHATVQGEASPQAMLAAVVEEGYQAEVVGA